jgi:hypothetical protein
MLTFQKQQQHSAAPEDRAERGSGQTPLEQCQALQQEPSPLFMVVFAELRALFQQIKSQKHS